MDGSPTHHFLVEDWVYLRDETLPRLTRELVKRYGSECRVVVLERKIS